jgi:hypothetical protein
LKICSVVAGGCEVQVLKFIIIIIFIIILHGLGILNVSGIDELPSFPGAFLPLGL